MIVINGYDDVPPSARGGALAIGNFDGVHRGHQELLRRTKMQGDLLGAPSGVMVFEPHPRAFFKPNEPVFSLTPLSEKLRLFKALNLDFVAVIGFDLEMANLTPQAFVERVLVGDGKAGFGVRHVVIGFDFFFGKHRAGTPDTMSKLGESHDFGVTTIAPVAEAGEVLSSSAVRTRLSTGDVRGAAEELGHWWRVRGIVTGGAQRGTGMGFPTANITLPQGTALGHGIFAVRVTVGDSQIDGAAYFGQRPTFDNGAPVLEVFLFDFDDNLYGREIQVEFIGYVRPDQRFPDMEALKVQMEKDCDRAKQILAEVRADPKLQRFNLGSDD